MKPKTHKISKNNTLWWSYTKLKVFEECRERFYRQYIMRQQVDDNQRRYLEGSVVHYLIENYLKEQLYKGPEAETWILDHVEPYYQNYLDENVVRFYQKDTDEKMLKSIRKSATNAFKYLKHIGLHDPEVNIISELEVREKVNHNILLNGKIDLLIQKGNHWTIADLKNMTSKSSYLDNTQLVFYNLLLYVKFKRVADQSEFFTCKDYNTVGGKISRADMKALGKRIVAATKIVRKDDLRKLTEDNSACYKCPYRNLCEADNLPPVGRGRMKW